MKKAIGIIVLGLLWFGNVNAGDMNVFKKKIKLPKDVAQGYKSVNGYITLRPNWLNFCYLLE